MGFAGNPIEWAAYVMKETKLLFSALLALSLVISACGPDSSATTSPGSPAGAAGKAATDPRKVATTQVSERSVDELVAVNGTLAAEQEIILGMKVAGRLAEVTVDLGSSIKKGE